MVNFCSQCGVRLESDASFCGSCGAPIGPPTAPVSGAPAAAGTTGPRPRGLSPKLIWSTLSLLALLGVGYVAASPYISLHGYQSAVERRAFGELADAFDRDELKRSLTAAINGALDRLRADDAEVGIPPNNELSMLTGLVTQGLGAGLDKALSRESLIELESMLKTGAGIAEVMVPPQKREEALNLYAQVTDGVAVSTGYVDLNTFGVEARSPALGSVRLLFKRHGLVGWRLAGIETNDALVYVMRRMGIGTSEKALADAALRQWKLETAERWLTLAAADKNAETLMRLAAVQFESANANNEKLEIALSTAKAAVEAGSYRAAYILGRMYDDGYRLSKDPKQSIFWFEMAYGLRPFDFYASEIAKRYARIGDYSKALSWAKKTISSEIYVPESMVDKERLSQERLISFNRLIAEFEEIEKSGGQNPLPQWISHLSTTGHFGSLYRGTTVDETIRILGTPTTKLKRGGDFKLYYFNYRLSLSMEISFGDRGLYQFDITGDLRDSSVKFPFLGKNSSIATYSFEVTDPERLHRHQFCPFGSENMRDIINDPNFITLRGSATSTDETTDNGGNRYYICKDDRVVRATIGYHF